MTPRASCPACDGDLAFVRDARDYTLGQAFRLLRCAACTLVTVDPVPSEEEFAAYYSDAFYGQPSSASGAALRFFHARREAQVRAHQPQLRRLLDVGCGDGGFLAHVARSGVDVVGVETSSGGAARARTRVSQVHQDLDEVTGTFDVVTAWHVLEHVIEPRPWLKRLSALLSDNGVLVIAVPNFGSVEARVGGDAWFHLDVPRHVHHFSASSLRGLLSTTGLAVEDISTFSVEYAPFGLMQTVLNLSPQVERNALYGLLKHGRPYRSFNLKTRAALGALALSSAAVGPAVFAAAALQAAVGAGSTLTAAARRT